MRTFDELSDKELFDCWALPIWQWREAYLIPGAPRNAWAKHNGKQYIIGVERGVDAWPILKEFLFSRLESWTI